MWRKPEETKAAPLSEQLKQSSPVTPAPQKFESAPAPARVEVPAASRVAQTPAGHLTSSLVIKGEITGREDLFIDGEVHGTIRIEEGRVTIGPNGRINADVEAREIVVRGEVKGNLQGRERVQIGQTGCARGDISTRRILVEDGAELHGRVEITRAPETRAEETSQANGHVKPAEPKSISASDLTATVQETTSNVA